MIGIDSPGTFVPPGTVVAWLFGVPPPVWFLAGLVAGVGLLAAVTSVWRGIGHYRAWQSVANTATERARSVAVGRTELEGRVREHERTLGQPFRDGDCVYARWRIQRRSSDDDGDAEWVTHDSGRAGVPFALEDDSGRIEVHDVEDASIDGANWSTRGGELRLSNVVGDLTNPGEWFTDYPRGVRKFVNGDVDGPWSPPDRLPKGTVRFEQEVLEPGESVYVLGSATPKDDVETGATGSERLKLTRDENADEFRIERTTGDEKQRGERRQAVRHFRTAALLGIPSLVVLFLTIAALGISA